MDHGSVIYYSHALSMQFYVFSSKVYVFQFESKMYILGSALSLGHNLSIKTVTRVIQPHLCFQVERSLNYNQNAPHTSTKMPIIFQNEFWSNPVHQPTFWQTCTRFPPPTTTTRIESPGFKHEEAHAHCFYMLPTFSFKLCLHLYHIQV